jgi:hypothetical protein
MISPAANSFALWPARTVRGPCQLRGCRFSPAACRGCVFVAMLIPGEIVAPGGLKPASTRIGAGDAVVTETGENGSRLPPATNRNGRANPGHARTVCFGESRGCPELACAQRRKGRAD